MWVRGKTGKGPIFVGEGTFGKSNVYAADASADAAEDVVRDSTSHSRDLLRVERRLAFDAEQCDIVAGGERGGVTQVDGGQIHGNRPQDRGEFAGRDHLAAI